MEIARRALPRRVMLAFIAVVSTAVLVCPAKAGPGHDHGPAQPSHSGPASPRLIAVSEKYELVGIVKNERLTIYLDRIEDTSPVIDAKVELLLGGASADAEPAPDGTYVFNSPAFKEPGRHEVVVSINEGEIDDLLVGAIEIPEPDHQNYDHDHSIHHTDDGYGHEATLPAPLAQGLKSVGVSPEPLARLLTSAPLLAGIALAFGIMFGAVVRGKAGLTIGLVGLLSVFGAGFAWAGPGHDHGEGGATALQGDSPKRLPDGELFLPKPTQRLLAIRTRILKNETARAADRLIGRVIADPNRSGLVQSTIGGRIKVGPGGLPVLGQSIKAGDILAYVEPAFAPIDASDVRQTAGDLEQRIAVLDARISRQRRLVAKEIASRANLEDLEIERDGLVARREQLKKSRNEPEVLVAPVDGIIAEVRVAAGQVVSSADTLIHIVDPSSLWIEAISFDPQIDPAHGKARARTSDGELFELTFVGRSRALQQQASVLQFRVDNPSDALNIGSPVKVLIEKGEAVDGLIVPKSAIAQAPNGQMVAFKRLEPERYLPAPVRIEDLDGERLHITGGLEPGDRIIVEGAPLVNQIR